MTTIEPQRPTRDEVRDLVKECGLDWQRGFAPLFDGDDTNRYEVLVRAAIEQYAAERVAEMQAEFDRTCLDLQNYAEHLTAERDSALLAYRTSEDDVFNLTQKVIPNLRAEHDALISGKNTT